MSRVLRAEGFRVLEAANAGEALRHLAGDLPVDCVVSDVNLPGLSGRELQEEVFRRYPTIAVILVAGAAQEPGVLAKPFTLSELKSRVHRALGGQ